MKKHFIFLLVTFLSHLFLGNNTCYAQYAPSKGAEPERGIMVLPATVSFNLGPGESGTKTIHIANYLPGKKKFTIYFGDWFRDSLGQHIYMEPGTYKHSCTNWVSANKTFVELDSGQSDEIIIKMQVPDSPQVVNEMKWSMLFCGLVEERVFGKLPKGKLNAGVTTNYRIGIHIYETPPSVHDKSMKLLSFKKVNDKKYSILYQNTGNTQIDIKSYVELSPLTVSKQGHTPKKIQIFTKNTPLFPEQKRLMTFDIPDTLAKGKYTITAALDAGSSVPVQAAQGVIDVK